MVNDRQITISVRITERGVNWQPQTLMLSEFYEKLRIPSRSTGDDAGVPLPAEI